MGSPPVKSIRHPDENFGSAAENHNFEEHSSSFTSLERVILHLIYKVIIFGRRSRGDLHRVPLTTTLTSVPEPFTDLDLTSVTNLR